MGFGEGREVGGNWCVFSLSGLDPQRRKLWYYSDLGNVLFLGYVHALCISTSQWWAMFWPSTI